MKRPSKEAMEAAGDFLRDRGNGQFLDVVEWLYRYADQTDIRAQAKREGVLVSYLRKVAAREASQK